MSLSPKFAVIQKAVAQVPLAPDLDGVLCTLQLQHIITPLNMLGNGVGHDDFTQVDHKLMMSAFQSGDEEYIIPYKDLGTSHNTTHVLHYLLVGIGKRVGRSDTVYDSSGSFTIHSDMILPDSCANTTSCPLGKQSFTGKLGDRIQ